MTITNDQAKSTAKADYITGKNLSDTLKAYAKDLLEARAQRDELLAALKGLYGWTKAEVEHFGATCPDDFIVNMVEKALKNA